MAEKVMKVRENKVVDGELTVIHRETGADCVLFDDGSTFQGKFDAGELTGPPGKDGAAGTPGKDGSNGKDGFSPTVATSVVGGGTKVTITDASGAHEFTVPNGKDGAQGGVGPVGPNTVSTTTGTNINGLLKGNGSTVSQAVAGTDYAKPPIVPAAVTLSSSGWADSAQTVNVTGVVADETAQEIHVMPKAADMKNYMDAGIYCSGQGAGTLTFTCSSAPSADISVYVTVWPLK